MIQRIAVLGANGRTGRQLVAAALARGWQVHALMRPGSHFGPSHPGLPVTRGLLTDPAALDETLSGCQAACCTFGPRLPYTDPFCAGATRAIIAAATRAGTSRLICITGAMIGPYHGNRGWLFDLMARLYARQQPSAATDRWEQEVAVRDSYLDWTVIKPPRLTDGAPLGQVRAGAGLRVGLMSKISRADLARLIIGELAESRFSRQTIFVAG